jgi:hypothetical protein
MFCGLYLTETLLLVLVVGLATAAKNNDKDYQPTAATCSNVDI